MKAEFMETTKGTEGTKVCDQYRWPYRYEIAEYGAIIGDVDAPNEKIALEKVRDLAWEFDGPDCHSFELLPSSEWLDMSLPENQPPF